MNAQAWSSLIIAVVAAAAGLAAIPASRFRKQLIAGGIVLLAVAIAIPVVSASLDPGDDEPVNNGSPSSTATTSATTTSHTGLPSKGASETRTSSTEPDPGADVQQYYLANLDYVDVEIEGRPGGCTGGCTGFEKTSAKIGPTVYPQSFLTRLDGDGDRSVSSWNALRSCSTFEATVGLTNESDTTAATFTVSKDAGAPKVLAEVSTGDSKKVSVDISGINRFTLAAYVSGAESDQAEAVWGDAALTCATGSLDE